MTPVATRTPDHKQIAAEYVSSWLSKMPTELATESCSEWIEKNMVITEGAYPGPYSFKITPYLREIADFFSVRSNHVECAVIKANQLGFSVISFGGILYNIAKGIGPQLFVSGDASMAEEAFEKRLDPLIESSGLREKIQAIVKKSHSKTTGDTKGVKAYSGTFIRAAGPNSEGKLRTFPSRINVVEEIDVFPQNLKGTGNPVEKIDRRADTFGPTRRMYYNSTPKEKSSSQILPRVEQGDMRKYMWICPSCGKQQPFEWVGFHWEKDEHGAPLIEMDEEGIVTHDPVWYECQNGECNHKLYNRDKYRLLLDAPDGGTAKWVPTKKATRPGVWSYIIPAFYGFRTWLDIILQYHRVKDDPMLYPDFVNDVLAECSEQTVSKPEPHYLMQRAEKWSRDDTTVPQGVIFMTLAADVHPDRIEAGLVGWGKNRECWVLQYWTFKGETIDTDSQCWKDFSAVIEQERTREDGVNLGVPKTVFVDAGYNTPAVNAFCSLYPPNHPITGVYPFYGREKGILGNKAYRVTAGDIPNPSIFGNDQKFKMVLYHYLEKERTQAMDTFPMGYIHFPCDLAENFYIQLVAEEQFKTVSRSGKTTFTIENRKQRRNESLDVMKMNYAAVYFMYGQFCELYNKRQKSQNRKEKIIEWENYFDVMESKNA